MAKINCYSTKCNKNKYGYCTASNINVVGENAHSKNETICSSYEDGNMFMNAISNINIFSVGTNNNNTAVYCEVNNCFYNKNGSCRAENLSLKPNDINGSTACATFVEAY
jgi:hypothetical protein